MTQPESYTQNDIDLKIDESKRRTLKRTTALAGMTIAASVGVAFSEENHTLEETTKMPSRQTWPPLRDNNPIKVDTRVADAGNELEIVVTNVGKESITLNQVAPASIETSRGIFKLDSLLSDGPLSDGPVQIHPNQSLVIPIQHHIVAMDGSSISKRLHSLKELVSVNLSIVTDAQPFAALGFQTTIV